MVGVYSDTGHVVEDSEGAGMISGPSVGLTASATDVPLARRIEGWRAWRGTRYVAVSGWFLELGAVFAPILAGRWRGFERIRTSSR